MTKRCAVWVGIAAVGLLLAASVGWCFLTRPAGINLNAFNRIQTGMAQREVEGILRGPPGDYSDPRRNPLDNACVAITSIGCSTDVTRCRQRSWRADGRVLTVFFRDDGTVADKTFVDFALPLPPLSTPDRLKRLLGFVISRSDAASSQSSN
jgi:hypothetical protein